MAGENIFIIIPCFNEGDTIVRLIDEIRSVLQNNREICTVVIVDDCSTDDTLSKLISVSPGENLLINLLTLPYNVGHQGAIAQGLLFANANKASHAIVMDGDGEDDPAAIPELLRLRNNDIVNVLRGKRHEKLFFRLSYTFYRIIFRFLTNKKMNFGNYCLLSERVIAVTSTRTFIHLAAFLSKLQFTSDSFTFDRRMRMGGTSKMNMTSLVYHAFRSFVEYGQALLMLFLKLFIIIFILIIITIGYIIYLKIFTNYPILGWSSTFGIGLLTSALLCMGFFITGVLLLNLSQFRMNVAPVPVYKIVK